MADGLSAPAAGPRTAELREQVRQVDILETLAAGSKLLRPARGRLEILLGPRPPQLIVGGALFRILQRLISLCDFLEEAGLQVFEADNAEAALAVLDKIP